MQPSNASMSWQVSMRKETRLLQPLEGSVTRSRVRCWPTWKRRPKQTIRPEFRTAWIRGFAVPIDSGRVSRRPSPGSRGPFQELTLL